MEYTSNNSGKQGLLASKDVINTQTKDDVTGIPKPFLIGIGISTAIILAVAVITCSFCLLILRRTLMKKKKYLSDSSETVEIPSPFITTRAEADDTEGASSYSGLDLVTQLPQVNHSPDHCSREDRLSVSEYRSLNPVKSCEDLQSCTEEAEFRAARWASRSHSLASINFGFDAYDSNIRFSVEFLSRSTLTVVVHEVSSLPVKFKDRVMYVMVNLYPIETEGLASKLCVYGDSAEFEETFRFTNVTLGDLEKSTLKFCLYSKKKMKSNKEAFVGQVYLKGSDVNWTCENQQEFTMKLEKKQRKRDSTSEKYLFKGMGELFILLQYQESASRMKVLVRKAKNLPQSDKLLGKPVHHVVINLWKEGEIVSQRETSPQSGHSPVWNQPFLFDTPNTSINSFSLEFVIMRDRRYKYGVVGHVTVGPETSSTGISHWEETLKLHGREISQWHFVMPVFKFD